MKSAERTKRGGAWINELRFALGTNHHRSVSSISQESNLVTIESPPSPSCTTPTSSTTSSPTTNNTKKKPVRYNNLGESDLSVDALKLHNEQLRNNNSNLSLSWEFISSSVVLDPNAPTISPTSSSVEINSDSDENEKQQTQTCVICLDSFCSSDTIRTLPCNHIFHQECIDTWLSGKFSEDSCYTNQCPTCKSECCNRDLR